MGLQISASNTDLLINCQRPFSDVELDEREVGEAANYGSAFAEASADVRRASLSKAPTSGRTKAILAKWLPGLNVEEGTAFATHVARAWDTTRHWIAGDNPLGVKLKIVKIETPMATFLGPPRFSKALAIQTRETKLDLETHTYDLDENEIGGTPDMCLASADGKVRISWDDKTGEDRAMAYAEPSKMGQLRTLALQSNATHVAVFHSPRSGGSDAIYLDPISPKQLAEHHKALRLAMSRIGDGSLRPGPWCKYCPAKGSCPANTGEVIVSTSALVKKMAGAVTLTDGVDPGVFHQTWSQIEKLVKIAKDQIKEMVREGMVIERPDGRVLVLQDVERESLSMTSLREALGKKAGDEEIERLRKLGAIKKVSYEELRAK